MEHWALTQVRQIEEQIKVNQEHLDKLKAKAAGVDDYYRIGRVEAILTELKVDVGIYRRIYKRDMEREARRVAIDKGGAA